MKKMLVRPTTTPSSAVVHGEGDGPVVLERRLVAADERATDRARLRAIDSGVGAEHELPPSEPIRGACPPQRVLLARSGILVGASA